MKVIRLLYDVTCGGWLLWLLVEFHFSGGHKEHGEPLRCIQKMSAIVNRFLYLSEGVGHFLEISALSMFIKFRLCPWVDDIC